jgi:hypothetical protein
MAGSVARHENHNELALVVVRPADWTWTVQLTLPRVVKRSCSVRPICSACCRQQPCEAQGWVSFRYGIGYELGNARWILQRHAVPDAG